MDTCINVMVVIGGAALVVLATVAAFDKPVHPTAAPEARTYVVRTKTTEIRMVLTKPDLVSQDQKFTPLPVYLVETGDGNRYEVTPEVWAGVEPGKDVPWLSKP